MQTTVTALFADATAAAAARRELERRGTPPAAIELLAADTPALQVLLAEDTADAARGARIGALVGGGGAALAAALLALSPMPWFGDGWWRTMLIGGAIGAVVGAAIGLLIGSATGHQVQEEYAHHLERGGAMLAINTDAHHAEAARSCLRECGGTSLSTSVHPRHRHTA